MRSTLIHNHENDHWKENIFTVLNDNNEVENEKHNIDYISQIILTNKNMLTYFLFFFKIHQLYLKKNSINVEFQFLPPLIQNSNSNQVMISWKDFYFFLKKKLNIIYEYSV